MILFSRSTFALRCSVPRLTHCPRSFSRGPWKADPHSRVYYPPKRQRNYTLFRVRRARGQVEIFKNFFRPHLPPRASAPRQKPRKPLILLAIAGSVPKFSGNGERGMGSGKAGKKNFSSAQNFLRSRPSPPPRAAEPPSHHRHASGQRMTRSPRLPCGIASGNWHCAGRSRGMF